ncbi:MAG TPA: DsbE family thiol:disulfide interchange protein [Burkholderiales bacterium]
MKRGLPALALAVAALGLLAAALYYGDRAAPGRTVERPAPHFSLPTLARPEVRFSPQDLRGQVWVLNVWASWCAPCRDELPLLRELARTRLAPLYGLNYMDRRDDATSWLRQLGDPYTLSAFDADGEFGKSYGLRGLPVTYVIDRQGVIRLELTGPVTRKVLDRQLLPLLRRLTS